MWALLELWPKIMGSGSGFRKKTESEDATLIQGQPCWQVVIILKVQSFPGFDNEHLLPQHQPSVVQQ
jgi:hypothetical protein